jgi:hypothetical protein
MCQILKICQAKLKLFFQRRLNGDFICDGQVFFLTIVRTGYDFKPWQQNLWARGGSGSLASV